VALGSNGALFSEDGYKWKLTGFKDFSYNVDLVWAKDKFVLVSDNGNMQSSVDGINWEKKNSGTLYNLYGIAFGNDNFVTTGAHGLILVSEFKPYVPVPATSISNSINVFSSVNSLGKTQGSLSGNVYDLTGRLVGSSSGSNTSLSKTSSARYVISNDRTDRITTSLR
jgi:hypothetical protein